MRLSGYWFFGIWCLWLCGYAGANEPALDHTQGSAAVAPEVYARFIQLNREHPQLAQATALVQDQRGFLWIGSQHGLYRYDGYQLEIFRADSTDPISLSADWISSLMVDTAGFLWIGTRYGGLNRFDPRTEQFLRLPLPRDNTARQQVEISTLYQDRYDRIWVGTFGAGLFRWEPQQQRLQEIPLPVASNLINGQFINALLLDQDGFLWIGGGSAPLRDRGTKAGGALRWHPDTLEGQVFTIPQRGAAPGSVTTIKADAKGTIWLASYGQGLWRFDAQAQQIQQLPEQPERLNSAMLTDLAFAENGSIWVTSYDQGLWLLPHSQASWQQFRANPAVKHQLPSNNLTGIWLAPQQHIWLKSPAGIYVLSHMAQRVRTIAVDAATPTLLMHPDVFGIAQKSPHQFWIANRDGGLAEYDLNTAQVRRWPIQPAPGVKNPPSLLRHVVQDATGKVWLGTNTGLFWLDQQSGDWNLLPLRPGDAQPHIGVLLLDSAQQLWVGTRGDGLFRLNAAGIMQYQHDVASAVGLASNTISTLQEDHLGDLWIGYTDQGISRLDQQSGKIQSWREGTSQAAGLRFNGIQLIFQDQQALWVRAGNVNHRVLRDTEDAKEIRGFKAYLTPADTDDEFGQAIDFLWLYRQRLEQEELVIYGEAKGFQTSTWIGAWYVTPDGLHLRGGNQGVDYFRPADLPRSTDPLQVRLTALSLFNKKIKPAVGGPSAVLPQAIGYVDKITLEYQQDMFSLHFSSLDYLVAEQIRYRYRLVGFDRDWIETDASSRVATYTRLAPDDYRFEVMARRPGQTWQDASLTVLPVTVLPPWWLTWWAKTLAVVALASSIWLFLHFRLRNERRVRQWLESVVTHRTTELQRQNQALEDSYRDMTLLQVLAKQITASLDLKEIIQLCQHSLQQIMDVHVLAIGIYQSERETLQFQHWLEDGQWMPSFELSLAPELSLAAVCFNQQRDITIQRRDEFYHYLATIPAPVCGEPMQSVLYYPLTVNQEKIGCISLQSPSCDAFSPQQINLVQTLASHIAIAVANASIVANLQHTRQQLVMQEKMASLGGLVAGVAHEVNTPLGICVTAASHLHAELLILKQGHSEKRLSSQMFQQFLDTALAAADILNANTQRAAQLINSFKQIAIDQTGVSLREFEVEGYIQEVLASLQPELNRKQCHLVFKVPAGIYIYADAGALALLLTHLVMNSLQHGFVDTSVQPAEIRLQVSRSGQQILLEYQDNGIGMTADTLKRLFDPFFTTKRSEGKSGLGAHIVYNLVTAQLHGTIFVSSEPGQGVQYRIFLPIQRQLG